MTDAEVCDLARRAGLAVEWVDYADKRHRVPIDTIRRILSALQLPCGSADELAEGRKALETAAVPSLITATAGQPVKLPIRVDSLPAVIPLAREDGSKTELSTSRRGADFFLAAVDSTGYHTIEINGKTTMLAVAPRRCLTPSDIAPGKRLWGLTAQVYGLRSHRDCGIGDMAGVRVLARAAADLGADTLALSPMHALFAADAKHVSPYSPSTRLFYNALHADASSLFDDSRLAMSESRAGCGPATRELELRDTIDWMRSSAVKLSMFRFLFEDFSATDLCASPPTALAKDFAEFRATYGSQLEHHALFEALHAARLRSDFNAWCWKDWSSQWRDPHSSAVRSFAEQHREEILFHSFLQWIADRSFAAVQQQAREAGMRIGLIADIAVGLNSAGSYCWSNQDEVLGDLEIGAPPDAFNADGQNWGLTTFSPRALACRGFEPFLATLRSCMRYAGGVRIDHVMGMMRLWLVPRGAKATEGAYLTYPLDDLLRLTALESHRQRAIVIGEDLGTVPAGFRDQLQGAGIYGTRVLWFERKKNGFALPQFWSAEAVAMTSTHDLPTVAGWWGGRDIDIRNRCGTVEDTVRERARRVKDRQALWGALERARVNGGQSPAPDEGPRVATAAARFIAATPSRLALLPLEDALALEDQPNLPGTIDEYPNWSRRYPGDAAELLDRVDVRTRCKALSRRSGQ